MTLQRESAANSFLSFMQNLPELSGSVDGIRAKSTDLSAWRQIVIVKMEFMTRSGTKRFEKTISLLLYGALTKHQNKNLKTRRDEQLEVQALP